MDGYGFPEQVEGRDAHAMEDGQADRERVEHADACTPVAPHFGIEADRQTFYTAGIADLFYGQGKA